MELIIFSSQNLFLPVFLTQWSLHHSPRYLPQIYGSFFISLTLKKPFVKLISKSYWFCLLNIFYLSPFSTTLTTINHYFSSEMVFLSLGSFASKVRVVFLKWGIGHITPTHLLKTLQWPLFLYGKFTWSLGIPSSAFSWLFLSHLWLFPWESSLSSFSSSNSPAFYCQFWILFPLLGTPILWMSA